MISTGLEIFPSARMLRKLAKVDESVHQPVISESCWVYHQGQRSCVGQAVLTLSSHRQVKLKSQKLVPRMDRKVIGVDAIEVYSWTGSTQQADQPIQASLLMSYRYVAFFSVCRLFHVDHVPFARKTVEMSVSDRPEIQGALDKQQNNVASTPHAASKSETRLTGCQNASTVSAIPQSSGLRALHTYVSYVFFVRDD